MKDCKWDDQTLQDYTLGLLDDIRGKRIDEHLQKCPECRREVATLKLLFAGLERPSPARPSPVFDRNLSISLEKERYRRQLQRSVLHASGVVAALTCLLIMLTRLVFSYSGWAELEQVLSFSASQVVTGLQAQIGVAMRGSLAAGWMQTIALFIGLGGFLVFAVQVLVFISSSRKSMPTR